MDNYERLVEGLINKDEEAFEYIYHDTKALVYSIIVGIVKDKEASNDLMQDTYITMIEKIHQYKKGKDFKSWLAAIARNKAIDYYRRNKKEFNVDITTEEAILPNTAPEGERNAMVTEMLNLLTDIERQVFLLYIMDNLTHREIAKIMKIPIGTSIWHYHKALKKIDKMKGSDEHETK